MIDNIRRAGRILLALGGLAVGSEVLATGPEEVSPQWEGYAKRASEMLSTGNYQGVVDQLTRLGQQEQGTMTEAEREECEFRLALALYELDDAECLPLLMAFVREHPASPYATKAELTIGDYYFFNGDFASAAETYSGVSLSMLSGDESDKYTYRRALSLLKCGKADSAEKLFKGLQGKKDYRTASRFYLAYIDYLRGDLDKAYSAFGAIAGEEKGGGRPTYSARRRTDYVPTGLEAGYYMAQIEYKRGEYDRVIDHGLTLIERQPVAEMLPEIYRLVGESYFRTGDYRQAETYLSRYVTESGENANDTAVYDLGIINYNNGDIKEAEQLFSRLTENRDEIGQSAWLYIGQCAVKQGMDTDAALAFRKAYTLDFDNNVTETALYNYVAAGTRGGNIPFSSSIDMLEDFLKRFPNSEYAPSAREYLATVYYNEKNYGKALASINRISNPSAKVLEAKQKVLYELGVEAMSNNNAKGAEQYMTEAINLGKYDRALAREARLWLGDAKYGQGNYTGAEKEYQQYIKENASSDNRTLAQYDLAYALYMQGRYKEAGSKFQEALKSKPSLPSMLRGDAMIRLGDCRYYTGDYKGAMTSYNDAINAGASESDYAMYRRAVMYGLSGDYPKKIAELNAIGTKYPHSKWLPAAKLEKTLTYQSLDNSKEAQVAFEDLLKSYPNSTEARRGMLEMAISLQRGGKTAEAIEAYKSVISRWPSSSEAQLANEDLKSIYSAKGEIMEYAKFLATVPGAPQIDKDELEQLTFDSAQLAYGTKGDITGLEKYVREYPNGTNLSQALLDLSEAYTEKGDKQRALSALDTLLSKRPNSPQASEALYRKGELLESMGAEKSELLEVYRQLLERGGTDYALEAYSGIMRHTPQAAEKVKYARLIQQSGAIENEQMEQARYYEAQGDYQLNNVKEAISIYSSLAKNPKSLYGAMSAVALGQIYIDSKQYKQAEEVLTRFTDAGTPHEYWLARGYLALADAYKEQGKTALALEYVRSLRDNYPGKEGDIQRMINTRLNGWK